MEIEFIKKKINDREVKPLDVNNFYSVMLPLIKIENEAHILYEIRAMHLKVQPGEVCFPGGRIESGETPREAAVRETCEELNIMPKDIEILAPLNFLVKTGSYVLYPFAGIINTEIEALDFNRDEVDGVFSVPVSYFADYVPDEHQVSYKIHTEDDFPYEKISGGTEYQWRSIGYKIPFYEYEGRVIWGMTARVTKDFIERLKDGG